MSSQFATLLSPIFTAAAHSTELKSQSETTSSTTGVNSDENNAGVGPFSSVSSSKTEGAISGETSSGFSRDRTTVYKKTSVTSTTNQQTTLVTVTTCKSSSCSNTVSPAIVSTTTTTINGITTEYTTWCPISATESTKLSKLESNEKTTLVTVTSCQSGVCSETASPAIVSTATATVNDVVTVYSTWNPQSTNEQAVSSGIATSANEASSDSEAANTKTTSSNNRTFSSTASSYIAAYTTTTSNASKNSDIVVPASETVGSKGFTTSGLISVSQQPRSASPSGVVASSTASLEMSSYLGIANHLLTNSGLSVFIASLLLAII